MKLHENEKLFRDAVRATAQEKGVLDVYIEKDYWVTLALKTIFTSPIAGDVVFKGGTSLSKCYGLIERFSEDIDLVVIRREGDSNNAMTNKIRSVTETVGEVLEEIEVEGITNKRGMNRKTAHSYPKSFEGNFGQVRKEIIVEATWLGNSDPYSSNTVSSYIFEMMVATGQNTIVGQYDMLPFDVLVLDEKRTLCEKIMSLVRFSYEEDALTALSNKVRHIYDLCKFMEHEDYRYKFLASDDFKEMMLKVANDDVKSFKNNNDWLGYHPNEAIIFKHIDYYWKLIKATYHGSFSELLYGKLPSDEEITEALFWISDMMKHIEWNIDLEEE